MVLGACLSTLPIEVSLGSTDAVGDRLRNCVRIDGADANPDNDRDCVTVPVERPLADCGLGSPR